jgi:hypothetical protein
MKPDERADYLFENCTVKLQSFVTRVAGEGLRSELRNHIRQAVQEERERCARIVEKCFFIGIGRHKKLAKLIRDQKD